MDKYNKIEAISTIDLHKSKNEVLHTFMRLFIPELTSCEVMVENYWAKVNALLDLNRRFDDCLKNHRFSELTEKLQGMDSWSDKKWTAARYILIAAADSPLQERREAAKRLKRIFESFGKVRYMSYAEQSGTLASLCSDILENHRQDAELIGIVPLIEDLKLTNQEFLATFDERLDSRAEHIAGETADIRAKLIQSYRGIIMIANTEAYTGGLEGMETFVKNTNQLVHDFRLIIGQKPLESKPGDDTPGDGTETVKKRHYITFMNGGRQVARFRCVVGEPIPEEKIPAAPEGKKWDSIPDLMPDEPVTVNAVPIEGEGGGETNKPQDFTTEELRAFPVLPALYGSAEEISNPNSLLSPFNPLSQNYKLSNLLPGTPAPTDGEVPEGKCKVKFERENEEEEARAIKRFLRNAHRLDILDNLDNVENDENLDNDASSDVALLDTKPFYIWYDTGLSPQAQGFLPPILPGFHWYDAEHVLDSAHYTLRAVRNSEDENEDQTGEENETFDPNLFTPGMPWPADKPAPSNDYAVVTFEYHTGQTLTRLYRQGATIISQGNMPEPTEGYTWVGIYMILSTPTYTVTEEEE